ncbi:hypothetical protein EJ02DRAFT_301476, partial [Clathrospora elynae]
SGNLYRPRLHFMDCNHPMPLRIQIDAPSEAPPLLHNAPARRRYQPYCETVASSRPPSPNPLILQPLHVSISRPLRTNVDAQPQEHDEADQNKSLVQSAASSPAHHVGAATLLKTGRNSKRKGTSPNRTAASRDTESADPNHITQAVTPRGSHSLASVEVTAYDRTPSHPRMQQSVHFDIATLQTIPRKHIQRQDRYAGMAYHPLPPLPL